MKFKILNYKTWYKIRSYNIRFVFKILSVLVISGTTVFTVIACNDNYNSKSIDFLAKISKIVTVDATHFHFDKNFAKKSPTRFFILRKDNMIGYSFTSDNPWNYGDATVIVKDDVVWDKVASAYGFNRATNKDDIKNIMANTPIINVSFKYEYYPKNNLHICYLLDFQVK